MSVNRRHILAGAVLSSALIAAGKASRADPPPPMDMNHEEQKPKRPATPRLPAVLCRTSATRGVDAAYHMLQQGGDTLDAALAIATAQEDDPSDDTTGLGALPNRDGIVQLDACCFHGPTRKTAAVAGVGGIRNASLLARAVMKETGYPMLAGADATRFGASHGFSEESLTTERTQKIWALWKKLRSQPQSAFAGDCDPQWPGNDCASHFLPASQKELESMVNGLAQAAKAAGISPQWTWHAAYDILFPAAKPLFVATLGANGDMSCAATSSGLPWKLPGAASDMAMPGIGCYLDNQVGAAGASGSCEANTKIAGAHLIVENMRRGMAPEESGMDALRRIAGQYGHDSKALRFVEIAYYILRRDGAYACVSLWRGDRTGHVRTYTIHDGVRRSENCAYLFDGSPLMQA